MQRAQSRRETIINLQRSSKEKQDVLASYLLTRFHLSPLKGKRSNLNKDHMAYDHLDLLQGKKILGAKRHTTHSALNWIQRKQGSQIRDTTAHSPLSPPREKPTTCIKWQTIYRLWTLPQSMNEGANNNLAAGLRLQLVPTLTCLHEKTSPRDFLRARVLRKKPA